MDRQPPNRYQVGIALLPARKRFPARQSTQIGAPARVCTIRWVGRDLVQKGTHGDIHSSFLENLTRHALRLGLAGLASASREHPETLTAVRDAAEQKELIIHDDRGLIPDIALGHSRALRGRIRGAVLRLD
jgi:hypothetical protein